MTRRPKRWRLHILMAMGVGCGVAPTLRATAEEQPAPVAPPPPSPPAAPPQSAPTTAAPADPTSAAPRDVGPLLAAPRERHGIPAVAGVVLRGCRVTARGVTGVRRRGAPEPATLADRWHLGSCTKSMTATLCARLVEDGTLAWNRTLAEGLPDLAATMDPAWRPATLEQLLTNRSGAPESLDADGLWAGLWKLSGPTPAQRTALARGVLARPPLSPPGTRFRYSNAGFSLAGALAEQATGVAYEDLIRARLFEPLGITTAGFGAPGSAGTLDQPRGHRADGTPVEPGPGSDNPEAIAPAGRVHMSIEDWGKYVGLHLEGARGAPRLLSEASFRRLHTAPVGFEYAMGWTVADRAWARGRVLTHTGSNTMWFCVVWIAPEVDLATLVCSNQGGDAAAKACDEASWALIQDELAARRTR